jgi:hypothetical protein
MKSLIGIAQLSDCSRRDVRYHFKYRLFRDDGIHTQNPLGIVENHSTRVDDISFSRANSNYSAFFNLMQGDLRNKK